MSLAYSPPFPNTLPSLPPLPLADPALQSAPGAPGPPGTPAPAVPAVPGPGHGLGLRGAQGRSDYYHVASSLMLSVLRRRTGIPIALCFLHMAVARRVGLQVSGSGC